MAQRSCSFDRQKLPEVAMTQPQPTQATIHPYEHFEYYEDPQATTLPSMHPAPQYQQGPRSPLLSHVSDNFSSEHGTPSGPIIPLETDTRYSEVVSPDPEAVRQNSGEKEVYQYKSYTVPAVGPDTSPSRLVLPNGERKRICGLPKKRFLFAMALLLFAIIAIAIGLGVNFGYQKSHAGAADSKESPLLPANGSSLASEYHVGGELSPEYYSKFGAFNGSGIAIASASFGIDASIFVYFQNYTGNIVSYISQADGDWDKANDAVATNARNATPLSAVAYIVDEVATWHLFYVDNDAYVRQRTTSNASHFQVNIWEDGPLNALNLKANDADMIGLQACYWGNFYGDADNTYADGFNVSQPNATPKTGMHLWYATSDTSFDQYSWTNGDNMWKRDREWLNMNGRAGVGCQTWLDGTIAYVTMIDVDNTLEIWWKDTNITLKPTSAHPINKWVNTSIAIPNMHPSTSMGYTGYLIYQHQDETIRGINVSWAAENTSFAPAVDGSPGFDEWTIPQTGVPGTHLSITTVADVSGGAHLAVFFQVDGDDFKLYSRDISAGPWGSADVPVNGPV